MTAHITHQTCSIDGLIPIQVFQILPKAKKIPVGKQLSA